MNYSQLMQLVGDHGLGFALSTDGVAFLERELRAQVDRVKEVQYQELKARQLIPWSSEVDPGAESIPVEIIDRLGRAKILANSAQDVPMIDVVSGEGSKPVATLAAGYTHSIVDMWRAQQAKRPLKDRKARATRLAIETEIDQIGATGIPGATGFVNNPDVPMLTPLDDAFQADEVAVDVILKTLHGMVQDVVDNTSQIYRPDTVAMASSLFGFLSTLQMSVDNPRTVLQTFLEQNPWIQNIDEWTELETAGAGDTTRTVVYKRDIDVVEWDIPLDFWASPPQVEKLNTSVYCLARVSGVSFYHPKAAGYADGL